MESRGIRFGDRELWLHIWWRAYSGHDYTSWRRTYIQRRTHFVTNVFRRYIYSGDQHTYSGDRRTYFPDVRTFLAYVFWWCTFRWRTCSGDVRISLAYVFRRRTCYGDVRLLDDLHILPTYVFYQRTYSIDVRDSWTYVSSMTYVISWRTYSGDDVRRRTSFGTTLLKMESIGERRIPSTQNTLDVGFWWRGSSRTRFLGLTVASKITWTLAIYGTFIE